MKISPLLLCTLLFATTTNSHNWLHATHQEFICEDGVPYKENECNKCFCRDGNLVCTYIASKSHQQSRFVNCPVGHRRNKDCNKCWCVKDMGTVCKDKPC